MDPAQHRLAGARVGAPAPRNSLWRSTWLRLIGAIADWRQATADRRHLAELNDYYLKDIGLSRDAADVPLRFDPRGE